MTRPHSIDLRERAVARAETGEPIREIAEALGIAASCIPKWRALKRMTGGLAAGKIGGHKKRTLSGAPAEWLERRVREAPFTLRGLVAELAERGIKSELHGVWVFVHEQGLSFKKNSARRGASAP